VAEPRRLFTHPKRESISSVSFSIGDEDTADTVGMAERRRGMTVDLRGAGEECSEACGVEVGVSRRCRLVVGDESSSSAALRLVCNIIVIYVKCSRGVW
jgi:hypothetical protein